MVEYDSIVWLSYRNSSIDRLNKTRQNLNIVIFRSVFLLKMQSPTDVGRCNYSALFICNLLNKLIDFSDLVNKISLVLPSFNLKSSLAFEIDIYSTNYCFRYLSDRALCTINNVNNIDKFHNTLYNILFKLFFSFCSSYCLKIVK